MFNEDSNHSILTCKPPFCRHHKPAVERLLELEAKRNAVLEEPKLKRPKVIEIIFEPMEELPAELTFHTE